MYRNRLLNNLIRMDGLFKVFWIDNDKIVYFLIFYLLFIRLYCFFFLLIILLFKNVVVWLYFKVFWFKKRKK